MLQRSNFTTYSLRPRICNAYASIFVLLVYGGSSFCSTQISTNPFRVVCDTESFQALVHVPRAKTNAAAPVLLYLHGSGQSGDDLMKTLEPPATGGPPVELHKGRALQELVDHFVMVAPQTKQGWNPQQIEAFLDFLLTDGQDALDIDIDEARIYISGHSIGGAAALEAAANLRSPKGQHRFAAVVPVAPSSYLKSYDGLRGIPVWLHHGVNDVIAPIDVSDYVAQTLKDLNPEVGMVMYNRFDASPTAPGRNPLTHGGHASPMLTYNNSELYNWLLKQRLPEL